MDELTKQLNKIRTLRQYKGKSEEELIEIAQKQIDKSKVIESFSGFDEPEEIKYAKQLFDVYVNEYHPETSSDRDNLNHLIYLQVLIERIKKQLNKKSKDEPEFIPTRALEQLGELNSQLLEFKKLLGMTSEEKEKNQSDAVRSIENLKERFHKWINLPDNRANYQIKCGGCGHLMLVRRRLDKEKDEISFEHPWFIEGGILFNKELFKCYLNKKISKEELVKILTCSPDYIDWILRKFGTEIDKENV